MKAHLLGLMPNLKRFVLYSNNPQSDHQISINLNGPPSRAMNGVVILGRHAGDLFDNYSKLEENSMWQA